MHIQFLDQIPFSVRLTVREPAFALNQILYTLLYAFKNKLGDTQQRTVFINVGFHISFLFERKEKHCFCKEKQITLSIFETNSPFTLFTPSPSHVSTSPTHMNQIYSRYLPAFSRQK